MLRTRLLLLSEATIIEIELDPIFHAEQQAWGQLEAEIGDACREAIRSGQSQEEWRDRRAWSLFDSDNPRLGFRNRLTLVLDRGSDEWKRTVELYEVRNQIAHGELRSEGIDVSTVIEDFHRIQSSLIRS